MKEASFRMMLGFVVRSCAVELGREPSPDDLAAWANNQLDERGRYRIFGRPISKDEAEVILRNPDRMVAVRKAPQRPPAPAQTLEAGAARAQVISMQGRRKVTT